MVKVKFVSKSANSKTGNISQVYLDKSTCPNRCGMKDICYGKSFYCNMVWNKCNTPINELPKLVENSLCSYLARVSVAGDISDNISYSTLYYLNKAYCYTHCAINEHNKMLAKESKMVINFSCDNIDTTVPCVLVAESMKSNK